MKLFTKENIVWTIPVISAFLIGIFQIIATLYPEQIRKYMPQILSIFLEFVIIILLLIAVFNYVKSRVKLLAEHSNLLREDAEEIKNYTQLATTRRLKYIEKVLQDKNILDLNLPDSLTKEEDRLHGELNTKRIDRLKEIEKELGI